MNTKGYAFEFVQLRVYMYIYALHGPWNDPHWSYCCSKYNNNDLSFQEEYYLTHQCFLTNRALNLVVWNATEEERGLEGLNIWLQNLHVRRLRGMHLCCISGSNAMGGREGGGGVLTTVHMSGYVFH